MLSLIPEDLYNYSQKENIDSSPRDGICGKESLNSFIKIKNNNRDKLENKKKKGNCQNQFESKESSKHEEKLLFDEIRKVYCELWGIKDPSLIKKMSPLEMMTKIDSCFESMVNF